jgi:hypothetical protein
MRGSTVSNMRAIVASFTDTVRCPMTCVQAEK